MILKERPVGKLTKLAAFIRMNTGLDLERGGWVAGGAARAVFMGEEIDGPSDVDFFAATYQQSHQMLSSLASYTTTNGFQQAMSDTGTVNREAKVVSLYGEPSFKVQMVRSAYHEDLPALFRSIDFTICQFATDGHRVVYTERAEQDLENNILNVEHEYRKVVTRPARLYKYLRRGFDPAPGLLSWALDLNNQKTSVNDELTVQHAY